MGNAFRSGIVGAALLTAAALASGQPPSAAATVNGEVIPLTRVDAFIAGKLAVTPLTAAQLKELRTDVVADLIDDVLLKQFLTQHGPKVEAAEIDRHLAAFTEGLARKGQSLAGFLKESNQSEAELRETWTTLLQLNGYVKQHVTAAQLKAYYEANRDYFDRVEVNASHIVIRVGPGSTAVEKAAAKEKLQALRADLLAGKVDFAAAARKHSQCPSAAKGGDLGIIPRKGGLFDEAFAKATFSLKDGELSSVVESEFGLHLIRATGRKAGVRSTFERSIEDVREVYAEDFRIELVAKLRKQALVQILLP